MGCDPVDCIEDRLYERDTAGGRVWRGRSSGASFKSAKLASNTSDFSNASFADFTDAEGMTQDMVDRLFGNAATILPDGLDRPGHWPTEPMDGDDRSDRQKSWALYCAWLEENGRESRFCP